MRDVLFWAALITVYIVGVWHILGVPPIVEWFDADKRVVDRFRLDVSRLILMDGEPYIIESFTVPNDQEIHVNFVRKDAWLARRGI